MEYISKPYDELEREADKLITQCRNDITSANRSLEQIKREYEQTRKPILRVVYPEE